VFTFMVVSFIVVCFVGVLCATWAALDDRISHLAGSLVGGILLTIIIFAAAFFL